MRALGFIYPAMVGSGLTGMVIYPNLILKVISATLAAVGIVIGIAMARNGD